jgi:predicted transcriptional regulator/DNA-binding XRE family transcriptional regulator
MPQPDLKRTDTEGLGSRLRQIREEAGFTQTQLSQLLGIDQSALSRLEMRSDILVSTLRQYVEAVGAALRIEIVLSPDFGRRLAAGRSSNGRQSALLAGTVPSHRDVVFSIRPKYAEKIEAGTKTVELRRRFPQLNAGTVAFIYTTSPTRALTGVAKIESICRNRPSKIWSEFSSAACIGKDDFEQYFAGVDVAYAIKLREAKRLKRTWDLSELRSQFGFEPPQSYLYAPARLREAIKNECPELFN